MLFWRHDRPTYSTTLVRDHDLARSTAPHYASRIVYHGPRTQVAAHGGMPERSNGAVSKTAAAHPAVYRPVSMRQVFRGVSGIDQSLYPAPCCPVSPSWVAIRVAKSSSEVSHHMTVMLLAKA
jgi:hypothetical protein